MSRETTHDIFRGFFAINAMLREELALVRRALARRQWERKYNPNWPSQPRAPKGVPEGGQWMDGGGGGAAKPHDISYNRSNRPRGIGHNRPPTDSLQQIFPGLEHAAPSAIIAPIDDFLGITRPGLEANEAATRNVADSLVSDIQRLDPSYLPPAVAEPGGFPSTIEGRNNYLDVLRQDRAAAIYHATGDTGPLQVETLRFLQQRVDAAYDEAIALHETGRLSGTLSREQAIGSYIDSSVRHQARAFFRRLGIPSGQGQRVRVNRRARNSNEQTYAVPDIGVGGVDFDMTLTAKRPGDLQIRRFFGSDLKPELVVIVRPSQLGPNSTYAITRPQGETEMSRIYVPAAPQDVHEMKDHLALMLLKAPRFTNLPYPDWTADVIFAELEEGLQNIRPVVGEENYAFLVTSASRAKALFEADPDDNTGETQEGCKLLFQMCELVRSFAEAEHEGEA